MQQIYLDHNSTTPIDPTVTAAMQSCWNAGYVNPASQHQSGQKSRQVLEQHRVETADLLGAQTSGMSADNLVITSGGTESNNLALIGLAQSVYQSGPFSSENKPRILISAIEHPSVMGAATHLVRLGFDVQKIPVDGRGVVCVDQVESMLTDTKRPVALVSVMLANNETGILQPVQKIAACCRQHQVLMHTDATQAVGKIRVHFRQLGVDALTFSAHKFNGPRGVGGLLLRYGLSPQPILLGGFQQAGIRPGTEDVAFAAGMHQAIQLFDQNRNRLEHVLRLRNRLEAELQKSLPELVVIGKGVERVPQTLNVAFPGCDRQAILLAADMAGIAISTGSACASGSSELSPVLLAMQLSPEITQSAIRISLGVSNTEVEIDEASRRIIKIVNDLRR